ncbi:hypothetical protein [Streptomyces sp. NPDC055692]|uniref:hypothetical protein n=1 Tax=Streptomyces sp. NPDC055692 TaxID=3155683 RepID=UPI0034120730
MTEWLKKFCRERRVVARVPRVAWRLEQVERERDWALAAARHEKVSVRKVAEAAGLSPTRVHQLTQGADLDALDAALRLLRTARRPPPRGRLTRHLCRAYPPAQGRGDPAAHRLRRRDFVRRTVGHTMADSMASVSLTLVAADGQDRPIGALSVTAPGTIIERTLEQRLQQHAGADAECGHRQGE